MYRAEVRVELKPGVSDPEGANTKKALKLLGYRDVEDVASAQVFTITLDEAGEGEARARVEEMCERILANPVLHEYTIDLTEV